MKINLRSPQILFEDMTVHVVEDNAGIFVGINHQFNWKTTINGSYSGFGIVCGNHNVLSSNKHLVLHDDVNEDTKAKFKQN
ncbi:hypothetical protein [Metabacillus iocasae]|uniref:Uncharacterized protein n=1 Tax=Priestia iocasae TaxID=2291674 RepID=A0ABS2QVY0_9BACI|nr:hypothetical protein [Metabacillus iocasae]MBM7703433.1 hypothetical protein [Metabacillus iocasae]